MWIVFVPFLMFFGSALFEVYARSIFDFSSSVVLTSTVATLDLLVFVSDVP